MNKILIPALLVATVMVAGMFAFAPVEQASTVHTTIQASQHSIETILLEDVVGLSHDGGSDVNFAEVLILYDGIGIGEIADIEVNTNIIAGILPNDSTADLYLLQRSTAAGVWSDAGDWDTATGGRHMDVLDTWGLRLVLVDDGSAAGPIAFGNNAYLNITIIN